MEVGEKGEIPEACPGQEGLMQRSQGHVNRRGLQNTQAGGDHTGGGGGGGEGRKRRKRIFTNE